MSNFVENMEAAISPAWVLALAIGVGPVWFPVSRVVPFMEGIGAVQYPGHDKR